MRSFIALPCTIACIVMGVLGVSSLDVAESQSRSESNHTVEVDRVPDRRVPDHRAPDHRAPDHRAPGTGLGRLDSEEAPPIMTSVPGNPPMDLEHEQRDVPRQIESRPCPFNCNSAGFSRWGCREWREGDRCFIGPKR